VYSIGEIILVVVGILIALQINNYNEFQKLKQQEQQLLVKILSDLQSDSILIDKTITQFKKYQDLYYHLFDEINGKESFDSTLEYGLIRFSPPFNPIVKNNYQPIVDNIIDEQVRDNLSDYFRVEENVQMIGVNQFMDLQVNVVRPYLTASRISDISDIFSMPRYENNDPDKLVNYKTMKTQFNTAKFAEVLLELRLKSAASIRSITHLKEANNNLLMIIQEALNN
jgi:hypothetical protein